MWGIIRVNPNAFIQLLGPPSFGKLVRVSFFDSIEFVGGLFDLGFNKDLNFLQDFDPKIERIPQRWLFSLGESAQHLHDVVEFGLDCDIPGLDLFILVMI